MKRFILCLIVCTLLCGSVWAAPQVDDTFFDEHSDQCEYVNRVYITKESLRVYQNPQSPLMIGTAAEGAEILVTYIYTDPDGVQWGLCGQYEYPYGWFPMEGLIPLFDGIAFRQANEGRIENRAGQLDAAFTGTTLIFREYPGSQRVRGSSTFFDGAAPAYSQVFTDEAGRTWGYVESYFGIKEGWLCLDQPQWTPETTSAEASEQAGGIPVQLLAGGLVTATAAGFGLVEFLKRKRT